MRLGRRGGRGEHRRLIRLVSDSPLRRVDARIKMLLVLLFTAGIMFPLERLLLYAGAFALLLAYGRILGEAARQVRRVLPFLALLFALDWAFVSLDLAVIITVRFLLIVSVSALLLATTTPEEFRRGLLSLGMPYRYAFVLSLAFQSVPILADEWRNIREAQEARGIRFDRRSWRELPAQLRDLIALAVPAVVLTTRRAWSLTEAAHARGFGAPHRVPAIRGRISWHDWALVSCTLACAAVLVLIP